MFGQNGLPACNNVSSRVYNGAMAAQISNDGTLGTLALENRLLKESLNVMLEFKRLIDHMFLNQPLLKTGELDKYRAHFTTFKQKYKNFRGVFAVHLIKALDRIDDTRLTKCFNEQCSFPDCNNLEADLNAPIFADFPTVHQNYVTNEANGQIPTNSRMEANVRTYSGKRPLTSEKQPPATSQTINARVVVNNNRRVTTQISTTSTTTNSNRPAMAVVANSYKRINLGNSNNSTKAKTAHTSALSSLLPPPPSVMPAAAAAQPQVTLNNKPAEGKVVVKQEFQSGIQAITMPIEIKCKAGDCNQTFSSQTDANKHYKTHSKFFKCSVCGKLFTSREIVLKHFVVHSHEEIAKGVESVTEVGVGHSTESEESGNQQVLDSSNETNINQEGMFAAHGSTPVVAN